MSQNFNYEKMIDLQERTLRGVESLQKHVDIIESELKKSKEEINNLKIETAQNSKAIKYQWGFIIFMCFLIILIFGNI